MAASSLYLVDRAALWSLCELGAAPLSLSLTHSVAATLFFPLPLAFQLPYALRDEGPPPTVSLRLSHSASLASLTLPLPPAQCTS